MRQQYEQGNFSIPMWFVWVIALGFVLMGLGSFGILDNNEGLYAEIPREMLASKDWRQWVIPHLNGLPYMEKPPLLYWLTAISFALFGESEWAARVVPALSSLACVGMLLWFGNVVMRPQVGRLAALMFVSGVGVTAMSHVLMFDMLLTALMTVALMQAYRFVCEEDARFLRWSYAFLALALLAKGLVALVLFGIVAAIFSLASVRSFRDVGLAISRWFDLKALLIFFIVAAPWHIAASLVEPIFAWFYFVNEHVLRFLGKREPHDYYAGAWWYYLPRMAIYLFPWSFLLPCLMRSSDPSKNQHSHTLRHFLWVAWLVPLLFFSISSAKANYYLVAVMPFAAFHLALAIENRHFLRGVLSLVPGLIIAALAASACLVMALKTNSPVQSTDVLIIWGLEQAQFLLVAVGGIVILSIASAIAAWRLPRVGMLAYLVLPVWISLVLMSVLQVLEPRISTKHTAAFLQTELASREVYLYRNFEEQSSLPFYLKKPLAVIDPRSNDLFWGNKLRQNDMMLSTEQFAQRLNRQRLAIVVMDKQLKDFRASGFFDAFKGEKRIGASTVFFN